MWATNSYMDYEKAMSEPLTDKEIERMMYEKYPVTDKERTCVTEWMKNMALRDRYKKELKGIVKS